MRGNESHAWSTWRTAKAKERRGYLDDPAEAERGRKITETFLRSRSMRALTALEQDARSFSDFIADLLIEIEDEIPEKVTEPPSQFRDDEEAGR